MAAMFDMKMVGDKALRLAMTKLPGEVQNKVRSVVRPDAETEGLDKLTYEIAELFAGPLKDIPRATAAFSLLTQLFPDKKFSSVSNPLQTGKTYYVPSQRKWFYLNKKGEQKEGAKAGYGEQVGKGHNEK